MTTYRDIDALATAPPSRRRWREAAMRLPSLIAERDAAVVEIARLERLLTRWDAEMTTTPRGTAERDAQDAWWCSHLVSLEVAYGAHSDVWAALRTLAATIPALPSPSAPYWEQR